MLRIQKPTLVVNLDRVKDNIDKMARKLQGKRVLFRPHFKTHQSAQIAKLFRDQGVTSCAVSSVEMAQYFAMHGWNDITIAFPANVLQAEEINNLAAEINLHILVDSEEQLKLLADRVQHRIGVFIEIDTGYYRSGILNEDIDTIQTLISAIGKYPQFVFKGFLSHTGNTYQEQGQDVVKLFESARRKMVQLRDFFSEKYPDIQVSMGDTPGASLAENMEGISEMRPGNFVFYDLMQYFIGSCSLNEIAVAVFCPVVAVYPERNTVVIYGGGVHLSKEKITHEGKEIYGFLTLPKAHGYGEIMEGAYIKSLSQEHGIVHLPKAKANQLKVGDVLAVLPVHSCMTVDLNKEFVSLQGEHISKFRTY